MKANPSLRVVIADDEPDMRDYYRQILPRLGHQVVGSAATGRELLEQCRTCCPDLIITDINMPDLDGIEAANRIYQEAPLPVILVSAYHDAELIARAQADHIMGYLVKPIREADLKPMIALALREEELRLAKEAMQEAYERIRRDLQAAAQLQHALLPANLPSVAGFRFAWDYRACAGLGGDGLNVFWLDDDHVGFYLLDVSGHGASAALLSVTLARLLSPSFSQSTLLRVPQFDQDGYQIVPPAEVAQQLNQWILANPAGEQYFTLFYGILNVHTRRLCYVSAGHHPGLLYCPANSEPILLCVPGLPIGCVDGAKFEERVLQLQPGDRLFLYSDGFIEAMNPAGEQFRLQRMREAIQSTRAESVEGCVERLTREVLQWTEDNPHDDLSVLALAVE